MNNLSTKLQQLLIVSCLVSVQYSYADANQVALLFNSANAHHAFRELKSQFLPNHNSVFLNRLMPNAVPEQVTMATQVAVDLPNLNAVIINGRVPGVMNYWSARKDLLKVVRNEIIPLPPSQLLSTTDNVVRFNTVGGLTWGLRKVKAQGAWDKGYTGEGVKVLVMDSGVDQNHPDLRGRFLKGRDFATPSAPNTNNDISGHGSHVTGTVLADGAGSGLKGVAPDAKLLIARVCEEEGCDLFAMVQALEWAGQERVDVVNISIGSPQRNQLMERALQQAETNNVVVVAASGNDGMAHVDYPAAYPTAVAVGAINSSEARADFSQFGAELDVVAPGEDVFSTVPQSRGLELTMRVREGQNWVTVPAMPFPNTRLLAAAVSPRLQDLGEGTAADFQGRNVNGAWVMMEVVDTDLMADQFNLALRAGARGVIFAFPMNNLPPQPQPIEASGQLPVPVLVVGQTPAARLARVAAAQQASGGAMLEVNMRRVDYAFMSGTSMASPHVTGVVALIKQANPNLTPSEVRGILTSTAKRLGSGATARQFGSGLVDADRAVEAAAAAVNLH